MYVGASTLQLPALYQITLFGACKLSFGIATVYCQLTCTLHYAVQLDSTDNTNRLLH
jgi:hypothetical protein